MAGDKTPDRTPEEKAEKEAADERERLALIQRNREQDGRETGWFRTEGGMVLEYDLPLPPNVAGNLTRVANAAGDPWIDRRKDHDRTGMDPDVAVADLGDLAKYIAANEADTQVGHGDFAALVACVDNGVAGPYAAAVALRILRSRHDEMENLRTRLAEFEQKEAERLANEPTPEPEQESTPPAKRAGTGKTQR